MDHLLSQLYIQLLQFFDCPPLISSGHCQSVVALEALELRCLKEVDKHIDIIDQGICNRWLYHNLDKACVLMGQLVLLILLKGAHPLTTADIRYSFPRLWRGENGVTSTSVLIFQAIFSFSSKLILVNLHRAQNRKIKHITL